MNADGVVPGIAAEMRRIDELTDRACRLFAAPIDPEQVTRHVYRLYQKASISGDLAALTAVIRTIDDAITLLSNPGDLYLLKAHAAFKLHRLADVDAALRAVPSVYDSDEGRLIRADLDFQHGRYQVAESGYIEVLQRERSWGALARLAHFRGKMGDVAGADRLYEEAEDELTAKEMRVLCVARSAARLFGFRPWPATARRDLHYRRADAAYPGYWLVDEHIAELLGAEGRYEEAAAIFERIVAANLTAQTCSRRSASFTSSRVKPTQRSYWKERALSGYLQSAQRGEVHYYHHLADYYADVVEDGAAAVKWARARPAAKGKFRHSGGARLGALPRWPVRRGARWIDRALASGVVDAQLFFRAARSTGPPATSARAASFGNGR